MLNYLIGLAAIVILCGGWAVFQVWLSRHDPEAAGRINRCGNCSCERHCEADNPRS